MRTAFAILAAAFALAASGFTASATENEHETLPVPEKVGPFVTAGVSSIVFDWEFSRYGMAYNPKISIKVGRSENRFNLFASVGWKWALDYNRAEGIFLYFKNNMTNSWIEHSGFEYQQIQVPVLARWNFARKPGRTWFLGAGVSFDFALSSKYVYKHPINDPIVTKDNNFLNKTNFGYNFQFGRKKGNLEFYLYFNYWQTLPYNNGYIAVEIPEYYGNNTGFFNERWRVGISGVIYFANN